MAKNPALKPGEIFPDTKMRIHIKSWADYQINLVADETRQYVKVMIYRPTDTILEAPIYARALWWELLRLSGAGRMPGKVVMGRDEPITPNQIARILHMDVMTVVIPGLQHHITENRIVAYSTIYSDIPEYDSATSQNMTQTDDAAKVATNLAHVPLVKGREGKGREEKYIHTRPTQNAHAVPKLKSLDELLKAFREAAASLPAEKAPGVDLKAEMRSMELWIEANSLLARVQQKKDWRRFALNWLRKAAARAQYRQMTTQGEPQYYEADGTPFKPYR